MKHNRGDIEAMLTCDECGTVTVDGAPRGAAKKR